MGKSAGPSRYASNGDRGVREFVENGKMGNQQVGDMGWNKCPTSRMGRTTEVVRCRGAGAIFARCGKIAARKLP